MSIQAQIKPPKVMPEKLYLLYEFKGRAVGDVYAGRTTDTKNALYFAEKTASGKMKIEVRLCTATEIKTMNVVDLQEVLKAENRAAGQLKRKKTLAAKKLEQNDAAKHLVQSYGAFA
jgi:hypothetical protein